MDDYQVPPRSGPLRAFRYAVVPLILLAIEYQAGFSGMTMVFFGFLIGLYYVIRILIAVKNKPKRTEYAAKTLCLFATFIVTMLLASWNIDGIPTKAELIIKALDGYQAKHGAYPDKLDQLVPEFLPQIPKARPLGVGTVTDFVYRVNEDSHTLSYIATAPNAWRIYGLETRQWSSLD